MTSKVPGASRRGWGVLVAAAIGLGAVAGLGLHPLTAAAASSVSCSSAGGEPEIFYVNGNKNNAGHCAVIEPSSGTIVPGDTIGAVYTDETTINKTGGTVNGKQTSAPTFTVDGVPQKVTLTFHSGSKFVWDVTITVPSLQPGDHTAVVSAWDSDQNKNGGDFGQVTFHFTSAAAPSTPTPAPPTPTPSGAVQGLQTQAPAAAAPVISTPKTGIGEGLPLGGLALLAAGSGLIGVARRRSRS
jgi:hypothetical protein